MYGSTGSVAAGGVAGGVLAETAGSTMSHTTRLDDLYEADAAEQGSAFRGLFFACLFSMPVLAVVGAAVAWIAGAIR